MYNIEKGVPLPEKSTRGGRGGGLPGLASVVPLMEVGDCIFVPTSSGRKSSAQAVASAAHRVLKIRGKIPSEWKFTTRQTERDGAKGALLFRIA